MTGLKTLEDVAEHPLYLCCAWAMVRPEETIHFLPCALVARRPMLAGPVSGVERAGKEQRAGCGGWASARWWAGGNTLANVTWCLSGGRWSSIKRESERWCRGVSLLVLGLDCLIHYYVHHGDAIIPWGFSRAAEQKRFAPICVA